MSQNEINPSGWQRLIQRFAASRVGSWIFSHTLHHIDQFLMHISKGRISVPKVMAGLPVIRLTMKGAKSGKERTVPVLGMQDDDTWIVVASNWGSDSHPSWYYNLRTNPEVTVAFNNLKSKYEAREATDEEWETYWEEATELYVGFEPYRQRTGNRHIPIMVLEPRKSNQ